MAAAAEARAAWQRAANRCFVQEDAKRAPKLACCPSASSSSLAKQADTRPSPDGLDGFAPPSRDSLYSNLSPDSRWWLQLQPNYVHQRGQFVDVMDSQSTVKGDQESYEFVEMDSVDSSTDFKQVDPEFPHWTGSPWWRMTDKDDLASFVAQRSHDFIENCDLPLPQNTSFKRDPYASPHKKDGSLASFGISKPHHAISGPVSPFSAQSGLREPTTLETDPSKRKLLEALRHSQTRAREAEMAAKQAYAEKEHVVKLIFKQASQLFAYKQWLYLLQLENLYNQIKTNKIAPISSIFPASPWHVSCKKARRNWPMPPTKRKTRATSRCKHDVGKYAVVFAVGLGLVGAGLLLGWTVGWLLM